MVKIGFIVEGHSEAILVRSETFINYLSGLGIETTKELVINVVGINNLYRVNGDLESIEERVEGWLKTLYGKGAEIVFFVLDKENSTECFTQFKSKVYHHPKNIIVVAEQAIEAWFLADTITMQKFLHPAFPEIDFPETIPNPFDKIEELRRDYKGKGVGTKVSLANTIVHRCNFSLAAAAAHPACSSAAYFQRKLIQIAAASSTVQVP